MSERIQKQLAAEAKILNGAPFVLQIEAGESEPRPSDATVKNALHFIEGHLAARGASLGPPRVRTVGGTIEFALIVPLALIDEPIDLFSAMERHGAKFRAGRMDADGEWELVYPLPTREDDTFSLLPEPVSIEERQLNMQREIAAILAQKESLLARSQRGEISPRDASALMQSIEERMEMLELEQIRLREQMCGGQS